MTTKINLIDYIWVKLTPLGRALPRVAPHLKFDPEINGWSKWQLWHFASVFGPHLSNGIPLPVETEILTYDPKRKIVSKMIDKK